MFLIIFLPLITKISSREKSQNGNSVAIPYDFEVSLKLFWTLNIVILCSVFIKKILKNYTIILPGNSFSGTLSVKHLSISYFIGV